MTGRDGALSTSDISLWERWQSARDADALTEIVSRYSAMVFSTCKRVLGNAADAEDVAQECFLELMRATTLVRSTLGAWLHTLAVHRSLDFLKTNARRRRREHRFALKKAREADASHEDLLARVDVAIAELPEKLRQAVTLRFLEGRTHRDCAELLDVSESTVGYRVNKGIERVRSALKQTGVAVTTTALTTTLIASLEAAPERLMATLGKISLTATPPDAAGPGTVPATSSSVESVTSTTGGPVLRPGIALRGIAASLVVVASFGAIVSFRQPGAASKDSQPPRTFSEYLLTPSPMGWHEAEDWAQEQGGHLVAIDSQEEQDWLVENFGGERTLWIGLSDEDSEGAWKWTSGAPVAYTNWRPGEPNDELNTEDYTFMNFIEPGKWNDIGPTSPRWGRHFGIVEITFEE